MILWYHVPRHRLTSSPVCRQLALRQSFFRGDSTGMPGGTTVVVWALARAGNFWSPLKLSVFFGGDGAEQECSGYGCGGTRAEVQATGAGCAVWTRAKAQATGWGVECGLGLKPKLREWCVRCGLGLKPKLREWCVRCGLGLKPKLRVRGVRCGLGLKPKLREWCAVWTRAKAQATGWG